MLCRYTTYGKHCNNIGPKKGLKIFDVFKRTYIYQTVGRKNKFFDVVVLYNDKQISSCWRYQISVVRTNVTSAVETRSRIASW